METCDNCRNSFEDDGMYFCIICGASVCSSCISDDLDICRECEE